MAILHGSWILQERGSYLLVWGETWRRVTPEEESPTPVAVAPHPLAMTQKELTDFLKSLYPQRLNWELPAGAIAKKTKSKKAKIVEGVGWHSLAIALPARIAESGNLIPLHSGEATKEDGIALYPWQVEGIRLDLLKGLELLQALPLAQANAENSWLGADLRFWSHIARWSLDLLGRSKFLPGVRRRSDGNVAAIWQPLLDSATDQNRFARFTREMPLGCRTYQEITTEDEDFAAFATVDIPPDPEDLLREFLTRAIDVKVRPLVHTDRLRNIPSPVREWLRGLGDPLAGAIPPGAAEKLEVALKSWTAPVRHHLTGQQQFRAAFELMVPSYGDRRWTLQYFLQAADNPHFLIKAKTIWKNPVDRLIHLGRTIEHPQETLLSGFGLASRLFPPIETSLEQARPQFCFLDPDQAYQFLKSGAWRFENSGLGVILPPSLTRKEGWASQLGLSIRAEAPKRRKGGLGLGSLLDFQWELTIGNQTLSKKEFDRLVALNSPLVEINGEWVELRPQDIRAAEEFFTSRQESMALSLEDVLRLASGNTETIEKLPVVSFSAGGRLQELLDTLTNNRSLEAIAPPVTLQGELRPYQARGVSWLAFLESWGLGACLADDMGLGKTLQLITFLLHLQEKNELEAPFLVVCPTSVLSNWEREIKRFGPSLKTVVHHGDKRPKGQEFARAIADKNAVITSYALVYRDIQTLKAVEWQGIVLDEAQNIKNPQAKQSQAMRRLEASFRIALTGTPVENRLQELWSIMDFLNPGYLGSQQGFQRQFATRIEKYGDPEALQNLRGLVRPFILRRLKSDKNIIQDLPEKQEMPVFCGLSAEQAKLYRQEVDASLAAIESSEGIQQHGMILALLTKLKQVCNHPAHFLGEKALKAERRSAKLQRLEEMLEVLLAEGDRALIFTQFAEWGKLLKPYLEKRFGREMLFFYGGTRKKQREEIIDRFQNDPQGPPIMILSIKAGGVGLNLTRANHVFHYDRWWNPAVENQATDRVFRIGQTQNVQVHKFVCTGTLEEKIHDLIESKKVLAEQAIGAGENWLSELDTDQLRNLLVLDRNAIIDEEGE